VQPAWQRLTLALHFGKVRDTMDKNTLFAKTDLGREALTSRPPNLGPRLRSLLIMVDGKRPVADMDKLSGGEGSAAPLLEQLLEAGWIVQVDAAGRPVLQPMGGEAAASSHDQATVPAGLSAPVPLADAPALVHTLPFSEARRLVVRFINDQLGPMGEPLAMRVEACKTPADLQIALPRIRDGLKNFKNSATVQRFDEELAARLPKV
jgi:hypothetical protein